MKKPKFKVEQVILILVICVLAAYLFLRHANRIYYRLPAIQALSQNEITRLEISKGENKINLEKKDNAWQIVPQGFPADQEKVKRMLETMAKLILTDLVSEGRGNIIYGLDQKNSVSVRVFRQDTLLRDCIIGNAAATYRHTFLKLAGDPRIFYAAESFRDIFDTSLDDLRNKTVLQVNANEITAIEINENNKASLFVRSQKPAALPTIDQEKKLAQQPVKEAEWATATGKPANSAELNSLLQQFVQFTCEKYADAQLAKAWVNPLYKILLKGVKEYSLTIFPKTEKDGNQYPAISSESAYPFLLPSYKAEQIMKKPADLEKGSPAQK